MNYTTNVQPAPRLHKLTKADIILELVMSMNRGNSGSIESRPRFAEQQYNELVGRGIIKEEDK